MGLKKKILKGGAVLSAGSAAGKILALVRNIIIARILSPDDFGVAATFIVTLTFLQSLSEVAADKLQVQAKDGDDERFQRVLHLFQLMRGVFAGAVLFALAGPIANLFGVPEATSSFRILAVIPIMRGLAHLDMRRVQRRMNFKPFVLVDLVSQSVAVAVAAPIALWLEDYRAALWILVIQTFVYTSTTHLLAERRWSAAFDASYVARLFAFGWPLMINGFLMFIIMQGDRLVIGATFSPYTLAELGVYSVAMTLIMTPRQMLTRVSTSLMLPILSATQDDLPQFTKRYRLCIQLSALIAAGIGVVFITAGTLLVTWLYGEKYAAVGGFIGWLSAMQTMRIIRTVPAIAGLARADSRQLMYTNLARATSLVLLIAVAFAGKPLAWIAAAGFAGELVALTVATAIMANKHGLQAWATAGPTFASFASLGVAGGMVMFGADDHGVLMIGAATAIAGVFALIVQIAPFREMRELLLNDGLHVITTLKQMRGPKGNAPAAPTP